MRFSLLCCMVISLICTAPALSLPLTPDQVAVKAEQDLESQYYHEAQTLEALFNDQAVEESKIGRNTHIMNLDRNIWNEQAVTLFISNLEKTNWDVYKGLGAKDITLRIVRKNTVP